MRVGYADQNGHPYRSIGRLLIDRGELTLERASMQGIRDWGRRNPEKLPALLNENPSYVFFREVPAPPPGSLEAAIDGPIGALGVPLLRERTVAVDPRSIPLGAPVFLDTTWPVDVSATATSGAGAGHRRRDTRCRAGGFLLGLRRRGGPGSRPDAPGRSDLAAVAQGRAIATPMTHRRAVALMVLATLLWSIAGVVTRHLDAARSFEVTFWRSLFNALALVVALSVMRGPALWRDLRARALAGVGVRASAGR